MFTVVHIRSGKEKTVYDVRRDEQSGIIFFLMYDLPFGWCWTNCEEYKPKEE